MQQLSRYIYRYLVRSVLCTFPASGCSALASCDSPVCGKGPGGLSHAQRDSVFPLIAHKVKPADGQVPVALHYTQRQREFSALGKKANVFPRRLLSWCFLGWEQLNGWAQNTVSSQSFAGVFTQIPPFWMTAFTPSAGEMRHTHIYAHSAKIPCQGSSDNQILWASSVSPSSLLLSDCLLMLSTLLRSPSLPSASLQIFFSSSYFLI